MAIVLLGVAFFSGIGATGSDMKLTGDSYFDSLRLMDLRVVSTIGLNDEDISVINGVEDIEFAYGSYSIDATATKYDTTLIMKVHSLNLSVPYSLRINNPSIISGRLPERDGEAVVESAVLRRLNLEIGDSIELSSGKLDDIRNKLKSNTFVIVGVIESPYYISRERGSSSIGRGAVDCYMYIPQGNFTSPLYTEALISVEDTTELNCFSDAYSDLIEEIQQIIEDAGKIQVKKRFSEITGTMYRALRKNEEDLFTQAEETQSILDTSEDALNSALAVVEDALSDLITKQNEIIRRQSALKNDRETAQAGVRTIQNTLETLSSQENTLREQRSELEANKSYVSDYEAASAEIERGLESIKSTRSDLEIQMSSIEYSIILIDDGINELSKAMNQLLSSMGDLTARRNGIAADISEIQLSRSAFEAEISDAAAQIREGYSALNNLDEPKWYVLNRDTNPGYAGFSQDSDKIAAIGKVFPLIFFIVAALVCLTTITRLVDERRTEIGTLKSLGYSSYKIIRKYLVYAVTPTLIGGLIGGIIGMKVFPVNIINAYALLYTIPKPLTPLNMNYWLIGIIMGVGSTTLAAVSACLKELRETPSNLMRPRSPKSGQRTFLERIRIFWSALTFTQKVTVRNIFRYKKRFFMTIIGIAGCTALLLTGFGIRDSISDIVDNQYGRVFKYDMITSFSDNARSSDIKKAETVLLSDPLIQVSAKMRLKTVDAGSEHTGETSSVSLAVPENHEVMAVLVSLQDRRSGKAVTLSDDGVVVTEKFASNLGVKTGDTIYLKDSDENRVYVTITGIAENYFMHYAYMTPSLYERLYRQSPEYNTIYSVISKNFSETESAERQSLLAESILDIRGVSNVSFVQSSVNSFRDMMSSLNFVVIILILSAGALAFVVLLNLTNINISERIRELATIMVLGFTDKEVQSYVYRENAVLTVIGSAVGLLLGILLHLYVILSVETEIIMFGRAVKPMSFVFSVILTVAFSLAVNLVSNRKLRSINMVEALKSIE